MLHDLIIWPNALGFSETIIGDLRASFKVMAQFTIRWDSDKWYDNFKVFYSKSWQGFPPSQLQNAVAFKAKYCGQGDFMLIVFEDDAPEMAYEQTTEGMSFVNDRVFNKKKQYRVLTGGGHLVHTSNHTAETDRDLTLLLGTGIDDFKKAYDHGGEGNMITRNCTGVDGYDSLTSFFYTLNHTISYCVLRNFECLPDQFFEQGHEDIDLLVENLSHIIHLTAAKPISGLENRVDYTIRIANEDVQFDFRHVGDNYYDPAWERNILANRVLERGLVYVPGIEDRYYSLLYHAYVQKRLIKSDYIPKLTQYGMDAGIVYHSDAEVSINQLDSFMERSGYEYMEPIDKTVIYNFQNLEHSIYAFRFGRCIKHTEEVGDNGYEYSSKIFEGKDRMIKIGTSWLLEGEASFLEKLSPYDYFPKVLSKQTTGKGQTFLELSKIEGVGFDVFFKNVYNQYPRRVRSFVKQMVDILRILQSNGINHRDISPSNIIVCRENKKVRVGLIDFGWAINIGDKKIRTPAHLGGRYTDGEKHSDCYAVGVMLMDYWPDLYGVRWLSSVLFKAASGNTDALLKKAKRISLLPMGAYDRFRLLLRRHQRISLIWHRLRK